MEDSVEDSFMTSTLPTTNYFIYKSKRYPFNLNLFKLYSESFASGQTALLFNADVELINESEYRIPISDESILYFINYCQNQRMQKINLTNEDILSVNYLAKRYVVQSLIDLTENYILKHQDDFILFFLSNPDLDNTNKEKFEKMLSQKLIKYINDPRLISLPVPVLFRVLTKYQHNFEQKKETEIIDFLFECLDKKGRCASVLFSNVDLSDKKTNYLYRLLNEYSEIFDFHFINSSLVKTLYDIQNELIKTNEKIEAKQKDILEKVSDDFKKIDSVKNEINQEHEKMKSEIKNEINQIINQNQEKMHNEKQLNEQRISKLELYVATIESQMKNQFETDERKIKQLEKKILQQEQVISKCQEINKDLKQSISEYEAKFKLFEEMLQLTGSITATADSQQNIKGSITIVEKFTKLDQQKSKFIVNTNNSKNLGENEYENGNKITSLNQEFSIKKPLGNYFVHALIVDIFGHSKELISNEIKNQIKIFTFNYTGSVQSITLDQGIYKLEVWGAEGGENRKSYNGGTFSGYTGKGGYSVGTLNLESKTTLYVYVGESPKSRLGGWNGGGSGRIDASAGGGGCTDISLLGESGSSDWKTENHFYSRIIVAGGGGGSSLSARPQFCGGCGGGINGQNNKENNAKGGTQTDGYGFCTGGSDSSAYNSGGGGGWYGGHAYNNTGSYYRGGAGGSGYVYTSKTASNYPNGCKLNNSFYLANAETISGDNEIPSINNNAKEKGHSGNGFARITFLSQ